MKIILDRVIDDASDPKSRNPFESDWAEGLGGESFVLRSSRIAVDILLAHSALTPPIPLCSPCAEFSDRLQSPISLDERPPLLLSSPHSQHGLPLALDHRRLCAPIGVCLFPVDLSSRTRRTLGIF